MLKFNIKTNTYYLICDLCGYPFGTENLPEGIAENGVIDNLECYKVNGQLLCRECMDEGTKWDAETFLKAEVKRRKKEIENERARQIRERHKTY